MESEESVFKKKIKWGGKVCAAINCHSHQYNSTVSLFTFPKDKDFVNLLESGQSGIFTTFEGAQIAFK